MSFCLMYKSYTYVGKSILKHYLDYKILVITQCGHAFKFI